MTIEIAKDWFHNNIPGQTGYILDSENEAYTKTISETDLNFEFSIESDGKFERNNGLVKPNDFDMSLIFRYYPQSYCTSYIYWIRNR